MHDVFEQQVAAADSCVVVHGLNIPGEVLAATPAAGLQTDAFIRFQWSRRCDPCMILGSKMPVQHSGVADPGIPRRKTATGSIKPVVGETRPVYTVRKSDAAEARTVHWARQGKRREPKYAGAIFF